MAVKTLSQLTGSAHQLGDIIQTKRTSLDDGRSLIPCDGRQTSSKPLLDAVLPTGIIVASSRPGLIQDSAGTLMERSKVWEWSQTNNIYVGASQEASSDVEHFVNGGTRTQFIVTGHVFGIGVAADGVESFIAVNETTSLDLEIYYNEASTLPNTQKDIDTSKNYDYDTGHCLMSDDGQICVIFAQTDDEDIQIWKSTTGPSGTWSQVTINPADSATRSMAIRHPSGTATLSTMVMPTSKGIWLSEDSGATWTEDIVFEDGVVPFHVVMSADGNTMWAMTPSPIFKIQKTTNKGVNWTTVFEYGHDHDTNPVTPRPSLITLVIDRLNTLYLLEYLDNVHSTVTQDGLGIYSSADGGATWVYTRIDYIEKPYSGSTSPFFLAASDPKVNDLGTLLAYPLNDATDKDNIHTLTLSQGKFPPQLNGLNWKMVAD